MMALFHILALEVVGPARSSPKDLDLALAILEELIRSSESVEIARSQGKLAIRSADAEFYVLFRGDQSLSMRCAVDLLEMLRDLPAMTVRIALHTGPIDLDSDSAGARGKGIEEVRRLLATGQIGRIVVSEKYAESLQGAPDSTGRILTDDLSAASMEPQRLVILETEAPGNPVVDELESALSRDGHATFRAKEGVYGAEWAAGLESRIRGADAVVVFVSEGTLDSEFLQYQMEIAAEERRKRGRPYVIPIWLTSPPSDESSLGGITRNLWQATWTGNDDNERVVEQVRVAIYGGQTEVDTEWLDSAGGAIATDSPFYVRRTCDDALQEALIDHESIVLVKGPRQIGKTSLIGGGIVFAGENGWRCATTDFQKLSSGQLESESAFYRVLAATLARQTGFDFDFENEWQENQTETMNMDDFMRALIKDSDRPLVWFMDEADRVFSADFSSSFFGLVRSWHNARATNPKGNWERLTIVIGYATEVHLFIKDLNQSPFNVGRRIELPVFSSAEASDLNDRYGRPFSNPAGITDLYKLLGGQPFLTRRALDVVADGKITAEELFANADAEGGPFGDHLKRILLAVTHLPEVWEALLQSLRSPHLRDSEGLYRLLAAGILTRRGQGYELPCELYRCYLARHAKGKAPE